MAVDRRQANLAVLKEADEIQDKTKEAVTRIQRQVAATEEMAVASLDELRKQGQQMDEINHDLTQLSGKLDHSQQLQNRFDVWAGNWLGGKKRSAIKEAKAEMQKSDESFALVKEVFENEKYDSLTRAWRPAGLVLCSNPAVDAPPIFDPAVQEKLSDTTWFVDYSLTGVDAEGWTYAKDFASLNSRGYGEPSAKWSCYVRRRKWRYYDKRAGGNDALSDVKNRNVSRVTTKPQGALGQVEKIGYVPRNKVPVLQESAFGGLHKDREELDDETSAGLERLKQKDAEIDQSLNDVLRIVDNLDQIAGAINEETKQQAWKTAAVEQNLTVVAEKQAIVNARQKKLLKTS